MNILIYTLLGVYCDFLQITQPTYMAEQIINVILLLLETNHLRKNYYIGGKIKQISP